MTTLHEFKIIAQYGTYYCPALNHYKLNPKATTVICDRCKKKDLIACIGLEGKDLCLPCDEEISRLLIPELSKFPKEVKQDNPSIFQIPSLPIVTQPVEKSYEFPFPTLDTSPFESSPFVSQPIEKPFEFTFPNLSNEPLFESSPFDSQSFNSFNTCC